MGEWLLSRTDSTIVAGHEVPGVWKFSCASSKRPTGEQKTAQGFSPGNDTHKEIALKGRPNGISYNVYICCYRPSAALSGRFLSGPSSQG
jgi:hypothetical protein